MTAGTLTEREEKAVPIMDDKNRNPPNKEGTERDILQLVEVMRDGLCIHAIVDGLRGKDRDLIEQFLEEWPRFAGKAGTERDILQMAARDSPSPPPPEILNALDHLLGNRSSYLNTLVRLARRKHDWRTLPGPIKP